MEEGSWQTCITRQEGMEIRFKIFLVSSPELLLGCLRDGVESAGKTNADFQVFVLSSWVLYCGTVNWRKSRQMRKAKSRGAKMLNG